MIRTRCIDIRLRAAPAATGKKVVKYMLCQLEGDVAGVSRDWETDPGTIEHILPENPAGEWDEAFNPERQKDFIYRLGNLLLLEPSLNRNCRNAAFGEKLELYRESAYEQTKQLSESGATDWSPATLMARQQRMAERAAHVWRSDFS